MGFLAISGAFALVYVAARLAAFVYRLLCPVKLDVKQFGQWALVTGSTDGIGRAYAIELAKRGREIEDKIQENRLMDEFRFECDFN